MSSGSDRAHRAVVDAEPLGHAGPQVVLDDVGARHERRARAGRASGCLRSAAIARLPRLAPSKISAAGASGRRRAPSTLITSAPRSDSSRCAVGRGEERGEVDDPDAVQRGGQRRRRPATGRAGPPPRQPPRADLVAVGVERRRRAARSRPASRTAARVGPTTSIGPSAGSSRAATMPAWRTWSSSSASPGSPTGSAATWLAHSSSQPLLAAAWCAGCRAASARGSPGRGR